MKLNVAAHKLVFLKLVNSNPTEWRGLTDTEHQVYVRYRWSTLTVWMTSEPTQVFWHVFPEREKGGVQVFTKHIGNEDCDQNHITYPEISGLLVNLFEQPELAEITADGFDLRPVDA